MALRRGTNRSTRAIAGPLQSEIERPGDRHAIVAGFCRRRDHDDAGFARRNGGDRVGSLGEQSERLHRRQCDVAPVQRLLQQRRAALHKRTVVGCPNDAGLIEFHTLRIGAAVVCKDRHQRRLSARDIADRETVTGSKVDSECAAARYTRTFDAVARLGAAKARAPDARHDVDAVEECHRLRRGHHIGLLEIGYKREAIPRHVPLAIS
jgi:hypothetical protein